jgi:hypothetical protein
MTAPPLLQLFFWTAIDINRNELFDLMATYNIPVVDMTDDELTKELSKKVFKK